MKKYLKWIGRVLSILSLIIIVYKLCTFNWSEVKINSIPLFIVVLIIGVALKTLTVFMSGYIWRGWVSFFANKKADLKEALYVYTKANTGKYLPGNVMQYVERNLFADNMGISQKKIAASSLIEIVSLVGVALITGFCFSYSQLGIALTELKNVLSNYFVWAIFAFILCGIVGVCMVVYIFRKKVSSVLKEYSMLTFVQRLIFSMVGQAFVLTILGIIFVILYVYMGESLTLSLTCGIIAGYIISWVLGFVVPGAPGGIGVRELMIGILITPLIGEDFAISIALIHRLITIIGDFLAYFLGMVFCKRK